MTGYKDIDFNNYDPVPVPSPWEAFNRAFNSVATRRHIVGYIKALEQNRGNASGWPVRVRETGETFEIGQKNPDGTYVIKKLLKDGEALVNTVSLANMPAGQVLHLGPITYTLSSVTLPEGVTLRGVPGKTIIQPPPDASGTWLTVSPGTSAVFEDVILDGQTRMATGILVNGGLRFTRGEVRGIGNPASTPQAIGILQGSGSPQCFVTGTVFSGISGIENGTLGDSTGAHRGVIFNGQRGRVDACTFDSIGGPEDSDAVHFQAPADTADAWASVKGKVTNSTFINCGKRGIKGQASDLEISGNTFLSTSTDPDACTYAAVEVFGSRNRIHNNTVNFALAPLGIAVSSGRDNKVFDNEISVGVGSGLTSARGSTIKGIFDLGARTLISGNTVETSQFAVYMHGSARAARIVNNPLLRASGAVIVLEDGTDGHGIHSNMLAGSPTQQLPTGISFSAGSTNCASTNNRFEYVTDAHRTLTTTSGHRIGNNNYGAGVTFPVNDFGLAQSGRDTNTFADAGTFRSAATATSDAPAFDLTMSSGQLNANFDRDHSDALENLAHRLSDVPVVNLTGAGNGISGFTALGLLAHNGLQGGVTVNFANAAAYPIVAEVDLGTQSITAAGVTKFYPALLFQSLPAGLEGVKVEVDTGAGYVTAYTQAVTPARHLRLPSITATTIKKLRYTLNGTTPANGSFLWRRVMLYYPELAATQNKHPSWREFRRGHQPDGSHLGASPSLDFGSIAAGASATLTATVSGALVADTLAWEPPVNLPEGLVVERAQITATSQVTVRVFNRTGAAIDPPAGVWKFKAIK